MCKYCNLVSGDEKIIEEGSNIGMYIERHNNTYTLVASHSYENIEKDINYCPMCRKKVRR